MKISHVDAILVPIGLSEPYTIAYENVSCVENVFLCLETDSGLRGYGCAAPSRAVTNETAEITLNLAMEVIEPILKSADPLSFAAVMEELLQPLKSFPSAMAMVDMALYDLLGKVAKLPLYQLLGGFRKSMPTSITIGILPVDETISAAKTYTKEGFTALKVKGGLDVETDIEKMCRLREELGRDIQLRFDANQGYSAKEAHLFLVGTRRAELELLEQPTPKEDISLLGQIKRRADIPVMADESIVGLRDVFRLAKKGLVDMVNIKLMKAGGIDRATQIHAVARAAGIDTMVGCMDESALAIAAGLHFALSRPAITHADLDGHLDLLGDPASGAVVLENGVLYPTGRAGLGFDPKL